MYLKKIYIMGNSLEYMNIIYIYLRKNFNTLDSFSVLLVVPTI